MTVSVKARFEGGVLRPLEKLGLPEGATVDLTIVPTDWAERFRAALDRFRANARDVAADDVEAEIGLAADEVRRSRLGSR